MLAVPLNTKVNKPLLKAAIYRSLPRIRFDGDISRIVIANKFSPATLPVAEGNTVKSVFVLYVVLKRREYDIRNVATLSKLIPQKMFFALHKDEMLQLALMHTQLITSDSQQAEAYKLQLFGLNFDTIWENIVKQVGNIQLEEENTLTEQIATNAERIKIEKQIEMLEKRCRAERHKQIIELNKLL